jgi:RNA polymerase sigma-70 factor (ECF subfamily)
MSRFSAAETMTMTSIRERSKPGLPAAHSETQELPDFDSVFQQYWSRVCAVAYRLTGDYDEAQDLALETFLKLHQDPPSHDANLAGWLYRVTTRLGLNHLRARARRRRYESEAGQQDAAASLESLLDQSLESQRVRAALGRMKPRSAELVLLRSAGLTYAEIAAALEIRPASVGALLGRAEREFEKQYA